MGTSSSLYNVDLHIHSALSPCADDTMTPLAIVNRAKEVGLSIIALTDHNSILNCPAIMGYSSPELLIIPGMELQTIEEVHFICLFGNLGQAIEWQHYVTARLPRQPNNINFYGHQFLVDTHDHVIGEETDLLLRSTEITIAELLRLIGRYGGLAIPAHIDRPSYSILANLGFIPKSDNLKTVEISRIGSRERLTQQVDALEDYLIINSSDAHTLAEIGLGKTELRLEELSWEALKQTLGKVKASSHKGSVQ